ncbi:uncharacterized protein LOC134247038 [Saccostrea cucullata]|uniref:uncharacterized protein LOC134247038 n=1 Tax=Saccostrea cuccullata TaxID=36930 RepID=UPI002ED0518F
MDPRYSAQDILRCDLCETHVVQSHCQLCQINLCKTCVRKHLSDSTKKHRVVPYSERFSTPNNPKCPKHSMKCELYCEQCYIPLCSTCISSGIHKGHHLSDVLQKISSKTKDMEKELRQLETRTYPKYEEIASGIKTEKDNLETHYSKLTSAVTKQGEDWHKEINIIVNKRKSEIDEMKSKHLAALNKQEKEVKQITKELNQCKVDLKKILESNDIFLAFVYKSRNAEFRCLPPDLKVILPRFYPHPINTEQLHQMLGSLSELSITTEEHGHTMETPEAVSCPPVKPLLDEPELINTINTGYKYLYSVTCLSDEEIWTCGEDKIMKLYNLKGKLLKSSKTKSGKKQLDIAVTRSEDLVYTDHNARTVNIVKNKQIQEVIRLQEWIPKYVCSTSSGDLLVDMYSVDEESKVEQSKVVRYSGSTEKQTIQFDSEGKALYSSSYSFKYISENRNLDICVADNGAGAVVVVNQAGKLRFRYTAYPPTTYTKGRFDPYGITTDSQNQILIADHFNKCIHILDEDGQFLRYIDNCNLHYPYGLCVDTRDNLFVAEWISALLMDPLDRAQVLLLCDLCQKAALQSHCELCQINLCTACVGGHLFDSSKRHNVVPYKHRKSATYNYPKCPNHSQNHCELYCDQCDITVCSTCHSSGKHKGHNLSDVLQKILTKIKHMEKELKEFETRIYPKYEEIASCIKTKKDNLETHYRKLTTAVTKQGEDWHREINSIVNKQKSEIEDMKTKHLSVLNEQEDDVTKIIAEVKQSIVDLKKILESRDIALASEYKSRNEEFRHLPPEVNISLPRFSHNNINTAQLYQMFGSLSALSITTEVHGYTMETLESVSLLPVKPLLDKARLIASIDIVNEFTIYNITCLSDEEICVCGDNKIMKLYNLQGNLLKSIQTKSGNDPCDIAVTRSGDLIYTDHNRRTVNIVKNEQIQEVIRLQGWKPCYVCSASSGDLLVTMNSDDKEQSKVVRYANFREKQTIQFDDKGQTLYSSIYIKYISENRNLDICVADNGARAVVVVNQSGKRRFRYFGHPSKSLFDPVGITTDSQCQILTADYDNNCIHILDQDGQFLRYIDNCNLHDPWSLCVDTKDNLFVTECGTGKVKEIKYM